MKRTFHAKINKTTLFCCLLPSTLLTVYFFWIKLPLMALLFLLLMVATVERIIHTSYVFTDEDTLCEYRGRFLKKRSYPLSAIVSAEVVKPSSLALLKNREVVLLTFADGSTLFVTPSPAAEFCRYFYKRHDKKQYNT